mgnify:CR=1 FL=1
MITIATMDRSGTWHPASPFLRDRMERRGVAHIHACADCGETRVAWLYEETTAGAEGVTHASGWLCRACWAARTGRAP